ncbi:xanthine dehydrogenase family protein molybdopterin-binding subunit [Stappia sp. WLB 29]|uniref:xanthine dehydrogenase family protein molybdopterin-binding subunit n=1 Tax=Stappia sp. WLB 29 TaxID=2925220 RepID=UPI0020C12793|nr:xanthine dehydrogenase family protein molybdopterin-binding subunit [Stappia sp. WLB 29]
MFHVMKRMQDAAARPTRRNFLKMSAVAAGGLVVGSRLALPGAALAEGAAAEDAFTPFIRISPDGLVTVLNKHLDMGQGNATGLATLVAEELDASPEQMRAEFAPADVERYKNLAFGMQGTGGSTAIANSFEQYRKAGATARAMLVAAAAKAWGVPTGEITISGGTLSHASGKSGTFGEFAEAAAKLEAPAEVTLKSPDQWVYIGKSFPRLDVPNKTVGAPNTYGMDVQRDNMLVAVLTRPLAFGAKVKSFNADTAKAVKGVVDVIDVPGHGVAVLATSTWPAIKGREALEIEWDEAGAETRSSDALFAEYRELADTAGPVFRDDGDAEAAIAGAATVVEQVFEFPYLAHGMMEPMVLTIHVEGDRATLWYPSQFQTVDQQTAATVLGIPVQNVTINTLYGGGSFGRRTSPDARHIVEAASIAKIWGKSQPIKLVYTREDDTRAGYYRPMGVHKVRAGLDADGNLVGWHHRIVQQSLMSGTFFEQFMVHDGIDETSVEGVKDASYAIPAFHAELHSPKVGVPVLWWRSVGHTQTGYVVEAMMDKAAHAAGVDPLEFRRRHLSQPSGIAERDKDNARKLGVLDKVAEMSGWSGAQHGDRFRGIAVHKSFNTYVAEVAEVSRREDGTFKVENVWCAVDCGVAVNPDNVKAQMEGGIGYGLAAVLFSEITLTDGHVDQLNFDTYRPLRIEEMPKVVVEVLASAEAPSGAGEPGTPPVGPAVANAILAATGELPAVLPLTKAGLA